MSIVLIDKYYSWKEITLKEYLIDNTPREWDDFFKRAKTDTDRISDYLEEEKSIIYPPIYQVFRVFYSLPVKNIKVVLLGQDVYHNGTTELDGSAVGLSFSVFQGNKINPSLKNIYKELKNEGFRPEENGNLCKWMEQGVFLYNMALTVERGNPDSHTEIWYSFSEKVIEYIVENNKHVCWLLFGKRAQEIRSKIRGEHKIIETAHPSPFSANRGFFGSNCFKETNEYLRKRKIKPIEW